MELKSLDTLILDCYYNDFMNIGEMMKGIAHLNLTNLQLTFARNSKFG